MSVRSAIWLSAGAGYGALIAQFVAIIFVTRILSQTEMGGYAVAIAFFNILRPLVDLGLTRYVIQLHSVRQEDLRPVATVAWLMGLSAVVVIWFSANEFAQYFGSTDIAVTLRFMSGTILLYPFVLLGGALLARELRQDRLALVNTVNSLCQSATSIFLVNAGYGLVSLGAGYLVGFIAEFVLLLIFSPRFAFVRPGSKGVLRVFRFGLYTTGATVVSQVGNGAPDASIARMLSLAEAGIFSRSVAIVGMLRRGLDTVSSAVALPSFSRTLREGGDPRKAYLLAVALATGLMWPFLLVLVLLAEPLVYLLYGGRWHEVVSVSRYVALMSVGIPITTLAAPLLIALRKEAVLFRVELLGQSLKVLTVLVCSQWSLYVVAGGLIAVSLAQAGVVIAVLHHVADLSVRGLKRATARSLAVALATGAGCAPVLVTGIEKPWMQLAVGLAGAGVGWSFAVWFTEHPLLQEVAKTFGRYVPKLKGGRP